jgi:hypothetical protein
MIGAAGEARAKDADQIVSQANRPADARWPGFSVSRATLYEQGRQRDREAMAVGERRPWG